MLTISARESIRQVVGTLLFVTVLFAGSVGAITAGLAALSTLGPLSAIDRAAIVADPAISVAGAGAVLVGVALAVSGMAVLAVETVASGVRLGLDRSVALDRSRTPRATASRPERASRTDRDTTDDESASSVADTGRPAPGREDGDRETPDPTDWTARNSVDRSRTSGSDASADEWVFKGDESSDEADRTA